MFTLFVALIVLAKAVEYDTCQDPQIITGSTNIYLEDLTERTVVNGRKGVWVKITAETEAVGYTLHTLTEGDVTVIETVNCETMSEANILPYRFVVEAGNTREFFVSLEETATNDIFVVADKMLVSETETNPIVIRGEFLPLTIDAHTYTTDNTIYYSLIGRTNWNVEIIIDGVLDRTIPLKQDLTELVPLKVEAGIHTIEFTYAKSIAEYQSIEVSQTTPSILNAVFRPQAITEDSNCFEGQKVIVGYNGNGNGKLVIVTKANGLPNQKYLQIGDTCAVVQEGTEYEIKGDYKIIVVSDVIPTEESSSVFMVSYTEEPTVESSSTKPEESSSAKPEESSTKPTESSSTKPEESSTKPEESSTKPEESSTKPTESSTKPEESSAKPTESSAKPEESSTSNNENPDDDGMDQKTLIAIICVSVIVGILLLLAIGLLIFIIYRKCTSKIEYQYLN